MDNINVTQELIDQLHAYIWARVPDLDKGGVDELTATLLSHAISLLIMRPTQVTVSDA